MRFPTLSAAGEHATHTLTPTDLGNITIRAVAGVCRCKPQEVTIAVSIDVSATASAANSEVTLLNPGKIATSGEVQFVIDVIDSTGMAILDASDVGWVRISRTRRAVGSRRQPRRRLRVL